jgi:hypothetical protein
VQSARQPRNGGDLSGFGLGEDEPARLGTFFADSADCRRLAVVLIVAAGSQLNGASLFSYYLVPVVSTSPCPPPSLPLSLPLPSLSPHPVSLLPPLCFPTPQRILGTVDAVHP